MADAQFDDGWIVGAREVDIFCRRSIDLRENLPSQMPALCVRRRRRPGRIPDRAEPVAIWSEEAVRVTILVVQCAEEARVWIKLSEAVRSK